MTLKNFFDGQSKSVCLAIGWQFILTNRVLLQRNFEEYLEEDIQTLHNKSKKRENSYWCIIYTTALKWKRNIESFFVSWNTSDVRPIRNNNDTKESEKETKSM